MIANSKFSQEQEMSNRVLLPLFLVSLALSSCSEGGRAVVPYPVNQQTDILIKDEARSDLTLDLGSGVKMKLVRVPAGKFMMGTPAVMYKLDDVEYVRPSGDEGPEREVTISKPFYMGVYEVTQEQWQTVMGTTPWKGKDCVKAGATNAANYISWYDATEYCCKLSKKIGKAVCLPTEAQWEYACRAGSKTRFHYGEDYSELEEYAWYVENAGNYRSSSYIHAVGQKTPNAWGLYDMYGNVEEWCSDWYGEDSYASGKNVDPEGPNAGSERVTRGGCIFSLGRQCRSASRYGVEPDGPNVAIGLRVVVLP